ncbi:MAG: DUF177 domain-containing protein [Bacteroidales bacterium]
MKQGKHEFEFELGKDFFDEFNNTDILGADLRVFIVFEKNSTYLSLNFKISGKIQSLCDRCLEPVDVEIEYSPSLYVNFGEETSDLTDIDETMVLSRSEDSINLAKHIYDYICLNIPIQKCHKDNEDGTSGCNPEMIKKIENYSLQTAKKGEIDPRWEKLKNLYN